MTIRNSDLLKAVAECNFEQANQIIKNGGKFSQDEVFTQIEKAIPKNLDYCKAIEKISTFLSENVELFDLSNQEVKDGFFRNLIYSNFSLELLNALMEKNLVTTKDLNDYFGKKSLPYKNNFTSHLKSQKFGSNKHIELLKLMQHIHPRIYDNILLDYPFEQINELLGEKIEPFTKLQQTTRLSLLMGIDATNDYGLDLTGTSYPIFSALLKEIIQKCNPNDFVEKLELDGKKTEKLNTNLLNSSKNLIKAFSKIHKLGLRSNPEISEVYPNTDKSKFVPFMKETKTSGGYHAIGIGLALSQINEVC